MTKWGTPGNGDGQFYYISDITVDPSGYVYVADTGNDRIQKFRITNQTYASCPNHIHAT